MSEKLTDTETQCIINICYLTKAKCICKWPEEDCHYVPIRKDKWPKPIEEVKKRL